MGKAAATHSQKKHNTRRRYSRDQQLALEAPSLSKPALGNRIEATPAKQAEPDDEEPVDALVECHAVSATPSSIIPRASQKSKPLEGFTDTVHPRKKGERVGDFIQGPHGNIVRNFCATKLAMLIYD